MLTEIDGLDQADIEGLVTECREKLEIVDADLMSFGDGREVSKDVINRIFRVFHSVKGAAGYLQHEPLKELSHLTESVLEKVRSGSLELSSANVDVLLASADRLRQMVAGDQLQMDVDFTAERLALQEILHPHERPVMTASTRLSLPPVQVLPAKRLKVLVVEDDFSSRLVLQGLLSSYGECHIAVNGKEAVDAFTLARLSGQRYDLICMDINMPEMDGKAAVAQIRTIEAEEDNFTAGVKIFMTTSNTDIKSVVSSYQALCDSYITKPVDGKALEEQLASFRLIPKRD